MAGAIPALGSVANTLEDAPPHLLEIVMVADTGGTMQVFYDRGNGVSEADTVAAPLAPSPEAHTYQLPIPLRQLSAAPHRSQWPRGPLRSCGASAS